MQTKRFISMLFNHLEDEITKLMSLGIPEDKVMMLASEQVIHIYELLFEPRQHAMEIHGGSKVDVMTRVVWVTLQAHAIMQDFMEKHIKNHPAIMASYVRFLTKMTGANSAATVSGKISSLERDVSDLNAKLEVAKKAMTKVDSKLESAIKANSLKRN